MDFALDPDLQQIKDLFVRYTDDVIKPQAEALDHAHEYPHALIRGLGELGLFSLRYPEEVGGLGLGLQPLCLAVEEIARGSMSLAALATMQSLMGTKFLHMLGTSEIQSRLLQPALRGEKIGAICMTEPDSGSDLRGMKTRAERVSGGWKITGQKMWVTAAPAADFFTIFAKTGEGDALSIFLVERSFAGLHIGRAIDKLGTRGAQTSEVAFDGCFVPDSHCLSREEGDGEHHLRKLLAEVRIVTAAMAVGVAQAALDEARVYANERRQFGKPIGAFQAVQGHLAEMATDLLAARLMVGHVAWRYDAGLPHHIEASQAKLFASERAASICDHAARVFASYGYSMEYPVQRYLRDVRFTLIGGGTSEILRGLIARELSK